MVVENRGRRWGEVHRFFFSGLIYGISSTSRFLVRILFEETVEKQEKNEIFLCTTCFVT